MWSASEVPDQAEGTQLKYLKRVKARSSKEELEASILSFYLERIVLDLKHHEKGIAANFSYDIMKKRCNGVMKEMTKRKL